MSHTSIVWVIIGILLGVGGTIFLKVGRLNMERKINIVWVIIGILLGVGGTIILLSIGPHKVELKIVAGSCRVDLEEYRLYIGARFENIGNLTPYGLEVEVIRVDSTVIDSTITPIVAFQGDLEEGKSDSLTFEFALKYPFEVDSTSVVLQFQWNVNRIDYTHPHTLSCIFPDSSQEGDIQYESYKQTGKEEMVID